MASAFSRTAQVFRMTTLRPGSPAAAAENPRRLELAGHALAVENVHLAAPGLDPVGGAAARREAHRERRRHSRIHPGQRAGLARPLGQIGELFLRLLELAAGRRRAPSARLVPRRLDDAVSVLAVVPGVEVVLELSRGRGQLRHVRLRVFDALPLAARQIPPLRFAAALRASEARILGGGAVAGACGGLRSGGRGSRCRGLGRLGRGRGDAPLVRVLHECPVVDRHTALLGGGGAASLLRRADDVGETLSAFRDRGRHGRGAGAAEAARQLRPRSRSRSRLRERRDASRPPPGSRDRRAVAAAVNVAARGGHGSVVPARP